MPHGATRLDNETHQPAAGELTGKSMLSKEYRVDQLRRNG